MAIAVQSLVLNKTLNSINAFVALSWQYMHNIHYKKNAWSEHKKQETAES